MTARRDGATFRLDATASVGAGFGGAGVGGADPVVDIRANQVALLPADATPEALFRGQLRLDDIAAADANRDGTVTSEELRAARPRAGLASSSNPPKSLLDVLVEEATSSLLRWRR